MRQDLGTVGYQSAQATHAAIDYCMKWTPHQWWSLSNRLVILSVPDESILFEVYQDALSKGCKATLFCEPAKSYEATSLALEPCESGMDLSRFKLLSPKVFPYPANKDREDLVCKMENAHQNDKQTIMQHGFSIREAAFSLYERIYGFTATSQAHWDVILPTAFLEGPFNQFLRDNLHDAMTIWNYTLFHDCGKPSCLEYDVEGRRHFPEHEIVSSQVWSHVGSEDEARLMLLDMSLHRMKAEGLSAFLEVTSPKNVATLLLTSYAEVYANAIDNSPEGTESVSFKIKRKHLDRLTKKLVARYT